MSEPYLGQIEIFSFGFAPRGWALCQGQLMPISQYQALFSQLGTTYGGDGVRTFALPDLRGRVPMGQGNGQGLTPRAIGDRVGEETHTLTVGETPRHTHSLRAIAAPVTANNTDTPGNTVVLAQTTGSDKNNDPIAVDIYAPDSAPSQTMAAGSIGTTGGQAHANLMPYLGLNLCIALTGLFPTPS